MGNKIFQTLLDEKIQHFVDNYSINSKSLFVDKDGKIIHPGEFGRYREEIAKELIRNVIPERLEVGDGFVITSTGKISTQCDLIIYDKNNCPLIENNNKQRFFPIECVVAIGEIKSDLSKIKFKEALNKLKDNKLLRNEIPKNNAYIFNDGRTSEYNPIKNVKDQIITFIVCNKLDFEYANIVNEMDEIYDNDENYYLRHNMILSIYDGTIMYKEIKEKNRFIFYPYINNEKLLNSILQPVKSEYIINFNGTNIQCNKFEHIIGFLNYLYMGVSTTAIMYPEMTNYLGNTRIKRSIDENRRD